MAILIVLLAAAWTMFLVAWLRKRDGPTGAPPGDLKADDGP